MISFFLNNQVISIIKSEAMFSYASCQVWNSLPPFLREIDNVILFKKQLKCNYFDIAFEGINEIS